MKLDRLWQCRAPSSAQDHAVSRRSAENGTATSPLLSMQGCHRAVGRATTRGRGWGDRRSNFSANRARFSTQQALWADHGARKVARPWLYWL